MSLRRRWELSQLNCWKQMEEGGWKWVGGWVIQWMSETLPESEMNNAVDYLILVANMHFFLKIRNS